MRIIKFRGKVKNLHDSHCCGDLNDGTWVVGDLEIHRKDKRKIIHFYKEDGSYYRQYDVDENTVGQFTGMYDKNDKEIYEGDIIRLLGIGVFYVAYNEERCQFELHDSDGFADKLWKLNTDRYEVIGNMYEKSHVKVVK